ncbi:MAG: hypothetical protein OXU79_21105 [Gemmatimonadota bacterium]|nr:hypothetical protein [Gemmatimonadota bacterium]
MAEAITFPETMALEDKLPVNITAVEEMCDSYKAQKEKTQYVRAGVKRLCEDMQEINDDMVEILSSKYAFFVGSLEILDVDSLDEDSFYRIAHYLELTEKRETDYVDWRNRIRSAIVKMRECKGRFPGAAIEIFKFTRIANKTVKNMDRILSVLRESHWRMSIIHNARRTHSPKIHNSADEALKALWK